MRLYLSFFNKQAIGPPPADEKRANCYEGLHNFNGAFKFGSSCFAERCCLGEDGRLGDRHRCFVTTKSRR